MSSILLIGLVIVAVKKWKYALEDEIALLHFLNRRVVDLGLFVLMGERRDI